MRIRTQLGNSRVKVRVGGNFWQHEYIASDRQTQLAIVNLSSERHSLWSEKERKRPGCT